MIKRLFLIVVELFFSDHDQIMGTFYELILS